MENAHQLRTVEGRQEIYDTILQAWRSVTPLDRVKPPKDPNRMFVCPECGEDIDVLRYTRGWDTHQVDPETGYLADLIDEEITDADIDRYTCSEECGWIGDYKWFREVENERLADKESKAKEAKPIEFLFEPTGDINVTWTKTLQGAKDWYFRFPDKNPDGEIPF